jgi:hypothetical protein
MSRIFVRPLLLTIACSLTSLPALAQTAPTQSPTQPHNVILFVADGLRHFAPDTPFMPTFAQLRSTGVNFTNSHSIFPTVTTANASVIATGHYLGDTGIFGNAIFLGLPVPDATPVWNVESDITLPLINSLARGNILNEESLISTARKAGLRTAVLGKFGPALIQDITRNNSGITPDNVQTIFVDDITGAKASTATQRASVPLPSDFSRRLANDPYFKSTYFDNKTPDGDPQTPSRPSSNKEANVTQQRYLMDVLTRAILPSFTDRGNANRAPAPLPPFVVVFWSRDPDSTQHVQTDGPGLTPGINGPTTHLAFQNVDNNLKQLLNYLHATPDPNNPSKNLADTTDVFVTSDHGFGTVSRGVIDTNGTRCHTFAAQQRYDGVEPGDLPPGFLAIDLAHDLDLPLYSGDEATISSDGKRAQYTQLKLPAAASETAKYPASGALLGAPGTWENNAFHTSLIVIGGSLYTPLPSRPANNQPDPATPLIQKAVAALVTKPYVSGIFVDTDRFGPIPGALSLNDINLHGSALSPIPAVVVNFRTFATDPKNPNMTGVEIADTSYKQGQGMHGTLARHDTFNCMFAFGPDFKPNFSDPDPVSNADIAPTLAHILRLPLLQNAKGKLTGRVLSEALANGPAPRGTKPLTKASAPAANGIATILNYQSYTDDANRTTLYFDAAGFPNATNGLTP